MQINVTVKYFSSIREALGINHEAVQTAAKTMNQLRQELMGRSAVYADSLAPHKAVRMALNQIMCEGDAVLSDNAEVAFFPPVTGG